MTNVFKNVPESVTGILYIACGAIILLDVIDAIDAGLLVVIGAIFLIWHGFALMNGPKRISNLIDRFQHKK